MVSGYRILMALHIIGVISWMAGILYLFRLFIYHAEETETVVKERFVVMEARLYKIITRPAMYFSLLMGIGMIWYNPSLLHEHWLHAKLFFALCLIGITQIAGGPIRRKFENDENTITSKKLRFLNEVPTLLMIAIVFLVILKPF